MASIKVKFRPSTVPGQEGRIYYQILHERKVRQLSTEYKIYSEEWDEKRGLIIATKDSSRMVLITKVRESVRRDVERLTKINRKFDLIGLSYTADDVIEEFHRYREEYSLFNFMEKLILKYKQNGKIRTSETYTSTLKSFRKFRKDEDIMLDCITSEVMEEYEAWLRNNGLIPNSISFYIRVLRAVYNRAVEEGIIDNRYPFRKVYTGVDKTVKRALPITIIKKIIKLELSMAPALDLARDIFLLSFYLRGMSFIDMAFLKKSDLRNGSVTYRRRKTGQQLTIAWEPEMQMILDKYPENDTDYLLPIITKPVNNERNTYRNKGYNINHNLKKIAAMIGINVPITLYAARHSWASVAKAKGIPIGVISEGMGHDSEYTTKIYLAGLDTSVVDKANTVILKSLKK
ncbi:MAG: site-specific integrase [Duncaniella sp.]|uniref:tyrosine-type recombinase/integrase n=1 Tax=Duncaniella sp. TaxID=2518496 RepID=UPI0023C741FB|nr:site-specific integrase [Duncaniella sp.]MDE6091246.1 site-specific integrase [Duncaniella sp.]